MTNIESSGTPRPQPTVRVDRYSDRVDVFLDPGNVLIARRDEATGQVSWHQKLDEQDKEATMRIFAKVPWRPPLNRAARRRNQKLAKVQARRRS